MKILKKISQTEILKFTYESELEREKHVKKMKLKGYECTEQKLMPFNKKGDCNWYGEFVKHY